MVIYCPSCGAESQQNQQFCRKCGVNLGIIGKALTLSESIARGDRGPLPKVKEVISNLKLDHVGEEISRGLEQMNREIVHSFDTGRLKEGRATAEQRDARRPWWHKDETPDESRRRHIAEGAKSLFAGVGMMIAFYYFASAIILKIPVDAAARIPVELEPLIANIWVLGLIPALKGLGELVGVMMAGPVQRLSEAPPRPEIASGEQVVTGSIEETPPYTAPSVTEGTTELFGDEARRDAERRTPQL
jgi:hypothetical protein